MRRTKSKGDLESKENLGKTDLQHCLHVNLSVHKE